MIFQGWEFSFHQYSQWLYTLWENEIENCKSNIEHNFEKITKTLLIRSKSKIEKISRSYLIQIFLPEGLYICLRKKTSEKKHGNCVFVHLKKYIYIVVDMALFVIVIPNILTCHRFLRYYLVFGWPTSFLWASPDMT